MNYFIIFYVALGIVLSSVVTIEYDCIGSERFPKYYGSPFIYKQDSLASSLECFYSISGLALNSLIWSFMLFFIHKMCSKLLATLNQPIIYKAYKAIIVFLIFLSTVVIYFSFELTGSGFDKNSNYWYFDLNQEARDWGMQCEGTIKI